MKIVVVTKRPDFLKVIKTVSPKSIKVEKVVETTKSIESINELFRPDIIIVDIDLVPFDRNFSKISDFLKAKVIITNEKMFTNKFINLRKRFMTYLSNSLEIEISKALIKQGIHPKLKGYEYIKKSVLYLKEYQYSMQDLYKKLSLEHDKSTESIERAIRTCVESSSSFDTNKEIIYYLYNEIE